MRYVMMILVSLVLQACQTTAPFTKTAKSVDIERYMGKWYVIASRPTFLEKDTFNATENYTFNPETQKIDVDFKFQKGSFAARQRNLGQRARIYNKETNAHWKLRLKWLPFEFDYLIIDLDPDYQWTAVGVPSQKYLWIMSRKPQMSPEQYKAIVSRIDSMGYDTLDLKFTPQQVDR